ncbi:23177_t:CDS:2 [Rhizophagus irregularis]|nr:23177_t:CDS:2 [Rhizophagus irregularis]
MEFKRWSFIANTKTAEVQQSLLALQVKNVLSGLSLSIQLLEGRIKHYDLTRKIREKERKLDTNTLQDIDKLVNLQGKENTPFLRFEKTERRDIPIYLEHRGNCKFQENVNSFKMSNVQQPISTLAIVKKMSY